MSGPVADNFMVGSLGTRPRRLLRVGGAGGWVVLAVVGIVMLAPLAALLVGALRTDVPNAPNSRWTLGKVSSVYGDLVQGGPIRDLTLHSLSLALPVTLLSTSVGTVLAWLLSRTDVPGRGFFSITFLMPLFYSVLVGVIGWIVLAEGRSGLINQAWAWLTHSSQPLMDVYSFGGIVWVMFLFFLPYALIFSVATFQAIDPQLEEAAAISGANSLQQMLTVTMRLALPSIAASALFIFVLAMEHFAIPAFLGTRIRYGTLAYAIYLRIHAYPDDPPMAAALGTLLILMTTSGLLLYRHLTRHAERFVTVSGKGHRAGLVELGRWRMPAFALCAVLLVLGVVLPLAGVVLRALMRVRTATIDLDDLGLANFTQLFSTTDFRVAIQNSLILSILGASICLGLGLFLAFWVVRRPARQTAAADYLISLPLGIPGTVFGVGMLWVLVVTPLYLTLWSLLLAFIIRYTVYGVRVMATGMIQIDRTLEDAGRVSGASTLGTFLHINLPLLRPAAASLWVLVFLLVMQELSSSIMLYGVFTKTLPILTWSYLDDGFYGAASAVAIVQLSLVAVVVALFRLVLRVNVRPGAQA